MQRSSAEHAEIVAALNERDQDAAARALRRHLVSAAMQILTMLSQPRSPPAPRAAGDQPHQD